MDVLEGTVSQVRIFGEQFAPVLCGHLVNGSLKTIVFEDH